ncbi:hypothetical protein ADUPG1_012460 [Aduncisulcus paluster]|nr:hypothetical protein ADUPG1_012460 [Aduncisulcus paluster]
MCTSHSPFCQPSSEHTDDGMSYFSFFSVKNPHFISAPHHGSDYSITSDLFEHLGGKILSVPCGKHAGHSFFKDWTETTRKRWILGIRSYWQHHYACYGEFIMKSDFPHISFLHNATEESAVSRPVYIVYFSNPEMFDVENENEVLIGEIQYALNHLYEFIYEDPIECFTVPQQKQWISVYNGLGETTDSVLEPSQINALIDGTNMITKKEKMCFPAFFQPKVYSEFKKHVHNFHMATFKCFVDSYIDEDVSMVTSTSYKEVALQYPKPGLMGTKRLFITFTPGRVPQIWTYTEELGWVFKRDVDDVEGDDDSLGELEGGDGGGDHY